MFLNPSDQRFFLRAQRALSQVCGGVSPTSCQDNSALCNAFDILAFNDKTSQSFVGTLIFKKNRRIQLVYKISKEEDNVVPNEYDILRQLDAVARACPHFVRVHGLSQYYSPIKIRPIKNLGSPGDNTAVARQILLLEYVSNKWDMYGFIESLKTSDEKKFLAMMAQVLMALRIAHSCGVVHNDIHCQNILVKECEPRIALKYIFKTKEYVVPTYGHYPVIIDFGLGRSREEEKMPLLGSFCFTHYGYYTDRFFPAADYVRFLSAVRGAADKFPSINKWCSKHLKPLKKINREMGWDTFYEYSAIEIFAARFGSKYGRGVKLFSEYIWVENLQLLINRPLEDMKTCEIEVFDAFLKNWKLFEERVASLSELNYLFKALILSIKIWRADYLSGDVCAAEKIKRTFLEKYERAIKFHCPKVDYEEMICSLLLGASYLEGFLFRHMEILEEKRPRRSGILSRPECDEEIWKSFQESFGMQLSVADDAKVKNCYFFE